MNSFSFCLYGKLSLLQFWIKTLLGSISLVVRLFLSTLKYIMPLLPGLQSFCEKLAENVFGVPCVWLFQFCWFNPNFFLSLGHSLLVVFMALSLKAVIKTANSHIRSLDFESQLYHSPAPWPWASYLSEILFSPL